MSGVRRSHKLAGEMLVSKVTLMILDDLRFGFRQAVKSPAFALAAIFSLTLGIGANTAVFSVISAVLLHPAGVDQPERVAMMYVKYKQFGLDVPVISVPDFADAIALKNLVEEGALEQDDGLNLFHDNAVNHLNVARVSWRWFQAFGAKPILGRTFSREEDEAGAAPTVVLGYGIWQRMFGGRQDILGETVLLDQKPYRVIGVMRSDFAWPRGNEIWTPLALPPAAFSPANRLNESYKMAVRLRPGVSVQQFNAAYMARAREQVRREGKLPIVESAGWSIYAAPLTQYASGEFRKPLYILFGVVILVLLIAAANVAGLFLARVTMRGREFAIRTALGANATSLAQQLLAETLLLAICGTAAALAFGPFFGKLLLLSLPENLGQGFEVRLDAGVLALTATAGILTCLISGLGPAIAVMRRREQTGLQESSRSATLTYDKHNLRSAFVIGEVALAFLLLAGTGLFLRRLSELEQVNPGFNPQSVLAAKVIFSGEDFKKSQPRQAAFVSTAVANLTTEPGVQAAAAVDSLPFGDGQNSSSFLIEEQPTGPNSLGPHSQIGLATPDYLKVMQIPLLRGRWFTTGDRENTQRVVVIDDRLARHYWPGQDPIGQHLRSVSDPQWETVVGVVRHVRINSLADDTSDGMRYEPFSQVKGNSSANFVLRTKGGNSNILIDQLKHAISTVDRTQTVANVRSLDVLVSDSLASRRLVVWMLGAFAGVALLLAVTGVYALISYLTNQRTVEVGVRMALGAQRADVLALVLKSSLARILAGLVIGLMLSVAAAAVLARFFSGMTSGSPSSLVFPSLALILAGGLAALIPAARAASINPLRALRNE
jgi:putative ABC transport system permease protein